MPIKISDRERAANIVRDAGGKIVGRTKLQKTTYLMTLAGYDNGFSFKYYHYGPYSEDLSDAIWAAELFGLVEEEEKQTDWGGSYSIYTSTDEVGEYVEGDRSAFIKKLIEHDSVVLELAATAAFLSAEENIQDPWAETANRKPDKAGNGRLEKAQAAYRELLKLPTPEQLPQI